MHVRRNLRAFATQSLFAIAFTIAVPGYCGEDTDAARALFNEARRLVGEGQYERACPLFVKSLALESGIGTQFNLADCWEHIGHNASAYELYRKASSAARDAGQPERERVATERADALAPTLSRLQVKIDASIKDVRVSRSGVVLEEHGWSEPVPVDAGMYQIVAMSADKKELWSTEVSVPERGSTVVVAVRASGGKPVVVTTPSKPKPEPVSRPAAKPAVVTPVKAPMAAPPNRGSPVLPVAGLVLGGAGLAFGTLFAVTYESKNSDAQDVCPTSTNCSSSDVSRHTSLVSDAKTARLVSGISFGVGAVSLSSVAAYYILKPSNRERPENTGSWQFAPSVGTRSDGFWGAAVRGTW